MDERFLRAFGPQKSVKLFGRTLKQFTLKHRVELTALDCALLQPDCSVCTYNDVEMFVEVVSGKKASSWGWFWRKWFWAVSPSYRQESIKALKQYLQGLIYGPKFWERDKARKQDNSPAVLTAVCWAVHNGISLDEAWNMPEQQAMWYAGVFGVINGSEAKFLTTDEEMLLDMLIKERQRKQ